MTPPLFHPACCAPLRCHWPFADAVSGARLVSTSFDPAHLHPDDFLRCAVDQPRGVAKRQTEYLAGRLCAREALRLALGQAAVPGSGEDRAPQWPAAAVGSISHGAGWAGAVVAPRSACLGLGLDVEALMPEARAERLAGEILTLPELERLATLTPAQRAERITLTFSFKESVFKALYPLVRQRFYFEAAELIALGDRHARLRLLHDLGAGWTAGRELCGQWCWLDGRLLTLVAIPADQG